jgi:hypothetical protein
MCTVLVGVIECQPQETTTMSIELSNLADVRARSVQQDFEQQTAFEQQAEREPPPEREPSPERQPSPRRHVQLGALLDPHTTSRGEFQSRLENWLSTLYSDARAYVPVRSASTGSVTSAHTGPLQDGWDLCDREAHVESPYLNATPTGFLESPPADDARNQPTDGADDEAASVHTLWEEVSLDGSEFEMVHFETEDCMALPLPRCLTIPGLPSPPSRAFAVAVAIGNTVRRVGQKVVALCRSRLAAWFGRATT